MPLFVNFPLSFPQNEIPPSFSLPKGVGGRWGGWEGGVGGWVMGGGLGGNFVLKTRKQL